MPRLSTAGQCPPPDTPSPAARLARESRTACRRVPAAARAARLALAALLALTASIAPPLVPEARAQSGCDSTNPTELWCTTNTVGVPGYGGFVAGADPDSTGSFGTLVDDDFDVAGATYTVWRLHSDTNAQTVHFRVATGDPPAATALPGADELVLQLQNTSDAADFTTHAFALKDAWNAASSEYRWSATVPVHRTVSGHADGEARTVRLMRPDTTVPTVHTAEVRGTKLIVTFTENLAAAASLANDAFTVEKTPSGNSEETVTLSGSPAINGPTVTLTLAAAVAATDTGVKVSYTRPTTGTGNKLMDAAGNEVATFTDQAVTKVSNFAPTVINRIPDGEARAASAFSHAFDANTFRDADGDTLTYTATKGDGTLLPSWLTFTPATRTFAGTPAAADVATLVVKVTASDGSGGTASVEFDIVVRGANIRPEVAVAIPNVGATAGTAFSYAFVANTFTDRDGDPLTYTAAKGDGTLLPAWLSFDAGTRTFSGTPAAADVGILTVKVTASDAFGGSVSDEFDVVVRAAGAQQPHLVKNTGQTVEGGYGAGSGIAQQFTTGGNTSGYALAEVVIQNNAGLDNLDVPRVSIYTADASGDPDERLYVLANPVMFSTAGNAPQSFTTPPNAILLKETKYFVVVERVFGDFSLTTTATNNEDAGGASGWSIADVFHERSGANAWSTNTANHELKIEIRGRNAPASAAPTVAHAIPDQTATAASEFEYQFPANTFTDTDPFDRPRLTYTATKGDGTELPSWLTFTPATRTFSGTPLAADVGTLAVKVTANDGRGGTVSDDFDIDVESAGTNTAATGTPTITGTAQAGQALSAHIGTIADTDGAPPSADFPTGYTFQWARFDAAGTPSSRTAIAGATSRTYTPLAADIGHVLKVEVSFVDGLGYLETRPSAVHPSTGTVAAPDCPAPELGARRVFLETTLTVGTVEGRNGNVLGYVKSRSAGGLATPTFRIGGTDYEIEGLYYTTVPGAVTRKIVFDLDVELSTAHKAALQLHVCADVLHGVSAASPGTDKTIYRAGPTIPAAADWSYAATRTVRLSLPANTAAGGAPTITGTAQESATLTANMGTIEDADGLPATTFPDGYTFQWVRDDAGTETDIAGATAQTYVPVADDVGKTLKVRVSFEDQLHVASYTAGGTAVPAASPETRTSEATAAVTEAPPNAPTITGTARVGQTLTATMGTIMDDDGLPATTFPAGYTFQWVRVDAMDATDISMATSQTYVLVAADEGKTIKVKVSFTDAAMNAETRTSEATDTVTVNAVPMVANALPDQDATEGEAFDYTVPVGTFSDGDDDTLTFAAAKSDNSDLPDWLSFTPATRTFTGTPADGDVGTLTVKVTASDAFGGSNSDEFDIVVAEHCAAPTFGATARHFWTGLVTVGSGTGYVSGGSGALDMPDVGVGNDAYTITSLLGASDALSFKFDAPATYMGFPQAQETALTLHVCDTSFDFDDATEAHVAGGGTYTWANPGFDWSTVTARTFYLSLPANNAATGAPDITGTAQVGETLSAGAGTIADADGLPATTFPTGYSFQWLRVTGENEVEIPSATARTYLVADADQGHELRVRIAFKDRLYVASYRAGGVDTPNAPLETRTSTSTGTVTGPPGAPASFTATAGDTQVTLAWEAPADDGGSAVVKYQYRYSTGTTVDTTTTTGMWTDVADGADPDNDQFNERSLVVGSLTNDTQYAFELRAVNAVGGGPTAGVRLASPGAIACNAPALAGRRVVWTGTLTVEEFISGGSVRNRGFNAVSRTGALSPAGFSLGSNDYTFRTILSHVGGTTPGDLLVSVGAKLTDVETASLRLHVCDTAYDFSDAVYTESSPNHGYRWADTIDWSGVPTRALQLSVTNRPATGVPTLTGTAEAGQTLTAHTDAIADPDGLAAPSFTYTWVRYDAMGGSPIIIPGETSSTYTLTASDVGRKLAVQVAFTDDLGNSEIAASTLHPQVGTVVAGTVTIAADRPKATGKLDSIHYTLTRTGDITDALTVPVRLVPFAGNDWGLRARSGWTTEPGGLVQNFTIPAGDATATVSIVLGTGFRGIGFSFSATTGGVLTARLGAVTGYDTDASAEVEVVVVPDPTWVVKLSKRSYTFAEDDGAQTLELVATASSPDIPPPSAALAPDGNSVLGIAIISEAGTARSPHDFGTLSTARYIPASTCSRNMGGVLVCRQDVTFTLVDDDVAEPDETLGFVVQQGPGTQPSIHYEDGEGVTRRNTADYVNYPVTIIDDEFGILPGEVKVTSTPRLSADTYGAWEHIEISVQFNRPVTVTGAGPTLTFILGTGTDTARTATYARGSGTDTLVLAYQVQPADTDTDGISWAEDALALGGATLTETDETATPDLAHPAQAALSSHKVDGTMTTSGAATVTALAVTSTPGITRMNQTDADTYGLAETIRFTATFSAAVTVTGAPELAFTLGTTTPTERRAVYDASSSTATTVVFGYRVVSSDTDDDGIAVGANPLRLGAGVRIRTGTVDANLARAALGVQSGHRVDGSKSSDSDPPEFQSGTVFHTELTLVFDEALDETSVPDAGDFAVSLAGRAGEEASDISMSGTEVALTLATPAGVGDAVTVTYTPGTTPLRDLRENAIATTSTWTVTNETAVVPVVSIAAVDAKATAVLAAPRFRVTLSAALTDALVVPLELTQDHAYVSDTSIEVTIPAGQTEVTHEVALSRANAARMSGDLTASLKVATGTRTHRAAAAPNNRATVGVVYPGVYIGWGEDAYTVTEGESVTTTARLRLAEGLPRPRASYRVVVLTKADTARLNSDYINITRNVVAPASEWTRDGTSYTWSSAVAVETVEDAVPELEEQLSVHIRVGDGQVVPGHDCTGAQFLDPDVDSLGDEICLATITITDDDPLAVTGVTVGSTPVTGNTYLASEVIEFRVAFTAAVDVDATNGTPELAFTLGSTTKRAVYTSGSGSATLVFAYTVAAGDVDRDGIAWRANALALEGATIRLPGSTAERARDADLRHGAGSTPEHRVDAKAPAPVQGTFIESTVQVHFDEMLDPDAVPAPGSFTLTGVSATVSAVQLSSSTVELTLSATLDETAVPSLTYTPGTLADRAGNLVAAFTLALDYAVQTAIVSTLPEGATLRTTEAGGTVSFEVALGSQPTVNVTVTPRSTDSGEGRVTSGALVFTAANWETPQTVTVEGVDDAERDGEAHYAIAFDVVSTDPDYGDPKFRPAEVFVINDDDEVNQAPVPVALAEQAAPTRTAFHYVVPPFTDPDGDTLVYSATLEDGAALPAWLAFDPATRTFTGTPAFADEGTLRVTVRADDGYGAVASATFALVVEPVRGTPDAVIERMVAERTVLTLTFTKPLAFSLTEERVSGAPRSAYPLCPTCWHFTIRRPGSGGYTPSKVEMQGTTVTLTLLPTVGPGEVVLLSYDPSVTTVRGHRYAPDAMPIRFEDGGELAAFTDVAVENETGDITPPQRVLHAARVSGTTLTIPFDEALDEDSVPAAADFEVHAGAQSTSERTVSAVAVEGNTVRLTLATPVHGYERVVRVSYDLRQSGIPIRDVAGNAHWSVGPTSVEHPEPTGDTTAPSLVLDALRVDGAVLTMPFDEALDEDSVPAAADFEVRARPRRDGGLGARIAVRTVAVSATTVRLTLTRAVLGSEVVTLAYDLAESSIPIRDLAGNPRWGGTRRYAVDNRRARGGAPGMTLTINRTVLTMTFAVTLDASSRPSRKHFTIRRPGEGDYVWQYAPSQVAMQGNTVTLTSRSTVGPGEVVRLSYDPSRTAPGSHLYDPDATPIRFAGGGALLAFTDAAVVNETADITPPQRVLYAARVSGTTLTIPFDEALDEDSVPAKEDFTVRAGARTRSMSERTVSAVAVEGDTVRLTLETPVRGYERVVTVAYDLRQSGIPIKDVAGNAHWSVGPTSVAHPRSPSRNALPRAVAVTVADAAVREGAGAVLGFVVRLDRADEAEVTVEYTTEDATARAGEDYTAVSGTLAFAPGETQMTVEVEVLDDGRGDALGEGEETLRLVLTEPSANARIADGEATGRITDEGPLARAWVTRFGRTVGTQVLGALGERLGGAGGTGSHVTVGGMALGGAGREPEAEESERTDPFALPEWATRAREAEARTPTMEELILGSAFTLRAGAGDGEGPAYTAWGRVARETFGAEVDAAGRERLALDGEVTTGLLGVDAEWEGLLAGVVLSRSRGAGTYRGGGDGGDEGAAASRSTTGDGSGDGDGSGNGDGSGDGNGNSDGNGGNGGAGTVESALTGVYPYARLALGPRVSAWAVAGAGSGELTLNPPGSEVLETGTSLTLGALGVEGQVLSPEGAAGLGVNVRTDVLWVRTRSEAMTDPRARRLAQADGDVTRLRLLLRTERAFSFEGGATFTPSGEMGLRHDGGDAETGTGVELGLGLRYGAGALTAEGRFRALVAHEADDYEEWGASASVRYGAGESGRGLTLEVAPEWGRTGSAAEQLWSARAAGDLVTGDTFEAPGRLRADLGYGFGLGGGLGNGLWGGLGGRDSVLTPYTGLALGDGGSRQWRFGVRWQLGAHATAGLEATRDARADGAEPADALALRAAVRF